LFEFIFQLFLFRMFKIGESKIRTHCSNIKVHNVQGLTMCVVCLMCRATIEIQFVKMHHQILILTIASHDLILQRLFIY
jgi:hypothetical protein